MLRGSSSLLVLALLGSACQIEPVVLEGKLCPCGDGYRCEDGRCTASTVPQLDAAPDAEEDGGCEAPGTAPPPKLAAGTRHTCAILQGVLYCWGANARGQLGVGDTEQRSFPERVGLESDWLSVAAGESHTCAIRSASGFGALYCWGDNDLGQCGLGSDTSTVPKQVTQNVGFRWVAAGASHTCGLETNGRLWCWGRQEGGAVGLGNLGDPMTTPARVSEVGTYVHISAGLGHNCAVRDDARMLCWGHFECFQLGSPDHQIVPHQVDSQCWRASAAGARHTCALLHDGTLQCFGGNGRGQLGIGSVGGGDPGYEGCLGFVAPQPVAGDHRWRSVAAGTAHTCGITEDGALYCWGYNEQVQVADTGALEEPTPVRVGTASNWVEVTAGFFHTCARNDQDEVYCRGVDEDGQQGTGNYNTELTRLTF